jgi:hypothetical protein
MFSTRSTQRCSRASLAASWRNGAWSLCVPEAWGVEPVCTYASRRIAVLSKRGWTPGELRTILDVGEGGLPWLAADRRMCRKLANVKGKRRELVAMDAHQLAAVLNPPAGL